MTLTEFKSILGTECPSITMRKLDGEFRITYRGIPKQRAEDLAAYTNDIDALGTARDMHKRFVEGRVQRI